MKNIINKTILMSLVILSMGACTKLNENPIGILAPESFFKTPADAEAAVMGSYSMLASEFLYGRQLVTTLQLRGDMCDIGDLGTSSSRVSMNNFFTDSNNGMNNTVWTTLYTVIGAANNAIDGIPPITMNEDLKNQLISEAKMVRALCYYHLVQLWGDVPYIGAFVSDPSAIKSISKTSAQEIYTHIIADCEDGVTYLPDTYDNGTRSRPTKGTAQTMLSSVYLILKDYANAAKYSQDVIDNASAYGYDLMEDYQDLWIADLGDIKEHVWTVDFKGGISGDIYTEGVDYLAAMTGVKGSNMSGFSVTVPSPGVYASFDDRDYRKKVSFLTETLVKGVITPYTEWAIPRVHIAKWCVSPGSEAAANGSFSSANYFIFRYAEVLLNAAEAINEANGSPSAKAYEYINKVRARARNYAGTQSDYPADLQAGMSQSDFREAVREERRVELAFEWERWYDLKRWGIAVEAFTGPNSYEPRPNFKEEFTLLPLPQPDLDRNPNLLPQNPGY